jgi:hypothetical protein
MLSAMAQSNLKTWVQDSIEVSGFPTDWFPASFAKLIVGHGDAGHHPW